MGFKTVAIARGADKAALAKKLGAHIYLDSTQQNVAEELTKLGGAKVILATVTDAKSMSSVVAGLGVDGKLVVLGVSTEPIEASPLLLISARRSISGWPSGTATDSEDTLKFSVMSDVRPAVEMFPLAQAAEAYQHMMSGKARFRVVLMP
jgi:D-arabinose 1-dehydrogenase-like Zn-dependent alcohol dehydrogenase